MLKALWIKLKALLNYILSWLQNPSTIAAKDVDPNSVVDYMKSRGMDSSLSNRRRLAKEYGYTGPLNGSAEMNMFLHSKLKQDTWPF